MVLGKFIVESLQIYRMSRSSLVFDIFWIQRRLTVKTAILGDSGVSNYQNRGYIIQNHKKGFDGTWKNDHRITTNLQIVEI